MCLAIDYRSGFVYFTEQGYFEFNVGLPTNRAFFIPMTAKVSGTLFLFFLRNKASMNDIVSGWTETYSSLQLHDKDLRKLLLQAYSFTLPEKERKIYINKDYINGNGCAY